MNAKNRTDVAGPSEDARAREIAAGLNADTRERIRNALDSRENGYRMSNADAKCLHAFGLVHTVQHQDRTPLGHALTRVLAEPAKDVIVLDWSDHPDFRPGQPRRRCPVIVGLYLARRDTRWDPYPQDEVPFLVWVQPTWGNLSDIRCARHGFRWPVPVILVEQASGPVARAAAEGTVAR